VNLKESFLTALSSIRGSKLRTSLTLLGIIIGVFSIIGVMTLLDALENGLDSGLSQLGTNTFQIQKYPVLMAGGPGARRKYMKRKGITLEQGFRLKEEATEYKYIGLEEWSGGKTVKYGKIETNPNFQLAGCTSEFLDCNSYTLAAGRFFNDGDINSGRKVAVIGNDVIDKLFPSTNPIGKNVEIDGTGYEVIGYLEAKGQNLGQSSDNIVLIPITTKFTVYPPTADRTVNITVMAESKETYDETLENTIGVFRQIRKVPPGEDNDFEIYSNESLIAQAASFTVYFKYGAGVISFISLIAAGIGIMNIMLVTVTERTKEIGIRMAIGAKRSNIMSQFLLEAIFICQLGGIIGIILGIGMGNIAGAIFNTPIAIPYDWVIIGLVVCSIIGIVFGTYPAFKASKLDPIDALRYE